MKQFGVAAAPGLASSAAFAFHCPADLKKMDAALGNNTQLAAQEVAEEQKDRAEGEARMVEAAVGRRDAEVPRRQRPRGLAESAHQPARPAAVERTVEGPFAARAMVRRQLLAAGDRARALGEVLLAVVDDVVGAVVPGELRLFLGAHGADDRDAERLQPLAGNQADAAGGGVP